MSPLADRVRDLLRQHTPAPLSEREAVQRLRPYGQGVQAAPVNPPLNARTPETLARLSGAREEQVSVARQSTS